MLANRSFLQGIYASSFVQDEVEDDTGTYATILNVIQIDQVLGQTPTPPCPRINIWRAPDQVGTFITSAGQYTLTFSDVPTGLISGIDIFSWRIPIFQNVTIEVVNGVEGIDYSITQEIIEEGTQTKTQLIYNDFGTFNINVTIINNETPTETETPTF